MRATRLMQLALTLFMTASFAQQSNVKEFIPKEEGAAFQLPQIQVVPIQDTESNRNYELYIKLPNDYDKNKQATFPVIYFTEALWHIEILSAATEYMLENAILVGISWQLDINEDLKNERGAHVSRFRDYSIRESTKPEIQTKYHMGQANKHLDFIRNDVITHVDSTYRTDPNSRTYFGYSLGGEFGAHILLTKPDTFNNYILGSPSIKNEVPFLDELNSKLGPFDSAKRSTSLNANVFISYGSLEHEMTKPIEEFVQLLNDRRDNGLSLTREVIDGNHQTAFPMTAVRSVAWLSTLMRHVPTTNTEQSLWETSQLNNAFVNASPEDKNNGIVVGELGIDSGNKEKIIKLAQEIADHKHGRFDSFLIAHKGKLVFESYYARGRINLPHGQASATKAYTGLALGRAIQLGYLTMDDLNKPLISFLKELDETKLVDGAEKITLNHALTMRSGIRVSEEQREEMDKNPSRLKGQGYVQALLERSTPITESSQVFKYSGDPDLVMQVIEAVVPGSAMDFIKKELLDKMGISNYRWRMNEQTGLPEAGWRSSMTSRDMVKWGTLVMNKGKWKDEQLIPKAFVERAISRILLTGDDDVFGGGKDVSNQGYGYYWWSADLKHGDTTYFSRSAQGGGGQYIILVDKLDLMVVVTAHDNENKTLQLTAERIIPAFLE